MCLRACWRTHQVISTGAEIGRVDLVCGDINMARWPKDDPHSHAHRTLTPHSNPLLAAPAAVLSRPLPSDTALKLTPGRSCGCPKEDPHSKGWRANVMEAFTSNHMVPVSDVSNDCCFIAAHDELRESHHVRGTSWAHRIGNSEEKWLEFSRKVDPTFSNIFILVTTACWSLFCVFACGS